MQKKPTPAPIFNYRKRPRQAVFADPQNDAMPGPSGAAPAPAPPIPKFSGTTTIGSSNQSSDQTNAQARGGFQQQQMFRGQQRGISSGITGRNNSNTCNTNPQTDGKFQANRQQSYSTSFSRGRGVGVSSYTGPYGDNGQQGRPVDNYGNINQQHPYGRGTSRNNMIYESFGDDEPFPATMRTIGGNDVNGSFCPEEQSRPTTSSRQSVSKEKSVSRNAEKTLNVFEKSLHIITCNVAGARRWNKFRDNIQLMFEVYGFLDSAVTKQGHDCKEFLLRDDRKDAMKCLFYEVDRSLPKLTRGQRIRCVGTYDAKAENFKVMSIRPVQDAERELYRPLMSKSDQLMHKVTKNLREL